MSLFIQKKRIVGLFDKGPLPAFSENRSPSTKEMAEKAIRILSKNAFGFFLMIEESQIDFGAHSNNAKHIKSEMSSLNNLVNMCLDYQIEHQNILLI